MNIKLSNKLDAGVIVSAFLLLAIGLVTLMSSGGAFFTRQLIWATGAIIFMVGLPFLNLRAAFSYRWVIWSIYLSAFALLVSVLLLASPIHGAKSWIVLGSFQIQPSEFMKIALIIFLSSFFAKQHVSIARMSVIFASFIYFLIPAVLIILQPDLGTGLILFGIWFGYLILSGLPFRHVLSALLIILIIGVIAWNFGLAGYQKARIAALFQPNVDRLGINYNVAQSKIAIGSAGIFGKGFGQGTQVQLGFLPAAQTDFIFSAFVEEWGLVGGALLILTFLFLIYSILRLGIRSTNNFARFVSLGTATMLSLHFIINLGSALGLLPVIGVGLPFVSYGGSNLLTVAILVGIIQGIAENKSKF